MMLNTSFCIAQALLSALLEMLFASAAHLLGDSWVLASDKRKTDWLLTGVPHIDFQLNVSFFTLFSHLSPNQTALLDYILLPFPPCFCVMDIFMFSFFLFSYKFFS